ncbi:hypothetical protein L9F63_007451 [Diploptera punctata]|uniref:Uncharacterized protein n=1 Tax=Diploptera punctata TaxID=6984 RepID=A0AAD7Z8J9_DIPPU|nr:hypothetical protein L9F63_007451 [Diploptera punctata]
MSRVLLLSILAAYIAAVWTLQCTPGICNDIDCAIEVEEGHKKPCNDDQVLTNRTFCGCCEICVTLVGEGNHCGVHIDLTQVPIPYKCKDGLQCVKDTAFSGVCVANNQLQAN